MGNEKARAVYCPSFMKLHRRKPSDLVPPGLRAVRRTAADLIRAIADSIDSTFSGNAGVNVENHDTLLRVHPSPPI